MTGESQPLRGLGPYNVREVAIGLLAVGIAALGWGLMSSYGFGTPVWLPLIGGFIFVVAGLAVWRWDLTHRA